MKVQGPGKTQDASKTKKSSKTQSGDGSFGKLLSADNQGAEGAQATRSIAQVDALLSVQEAEDPTQGAARKRMRFRANAILDELETLRHAMLSGGLTVGHMIDVADVVASHREKITDPALTAIMDEIDLRAQVELAKIRKTLDARQKS